ncbi:DUF547 domain-containing protein [Stappia sp. GBMRC 2046]|uniref:DUF547 domain-containing protein n=1 Tax=Stappia sediminis TaxID=2692190 RepID=A0A7X3LWK4_9HYPH|nr:DUF547 domain-containing protein [Stappia sediminis]MXN66383.1 DUF547 domain-containing protein [Stappia sediminis]
MNGPPASYKFRAEKVELSRRGFVAGVAAAGLAFAAPARVLADSGDRVWTSLLRQYVVSSRDGINRVRYAAFKRESYGELAAYLMELQRVKVSSLGRADQFAFWVNLYNAETVRVVLEHYPVRTIRDIDLGGGLFANGPWKKKLLTVEGRELSLDDIEHEILRKDFGDKRVHYAVNCASLGCPNLQLEAFTGARLDAMLDAGAADYINHPRGVNVVDGRVTASKIYNWFSEDFGGNSDLIGHWRDYARPELAGKLDEARRISDYVYDWGLNDAA